MSSVKDSIGSSTEEARSIKTTKFGARIHQWCDSGDSEQPLKVYTDHRLNHSRIKWFWKASRFIDRFGEARGVERQPENSRVNLNFVTFLRLTGIWIGATLSLPSMTGFFLGPLLFKLSFRASVSSGILGAFVGSLVGAYGATFGPRSGLRQMMGARFQFGWWFSKFLALLNALTLIGWLMVNGNFGGQLLYSLSDGKVSIQIGLLILFLVTLFLSVLGQRLLSHFDIIFIIPLFVAFLLCYVCTGHSFEVSKVSDVAGEDLRTAWVSNFQVCIGITSTWMAVASDYHLDMPVHTNSWAVFGFVFSVIFLSTAFVGVLGCGLASAALYDAAKYEIYEYAGGAGLIVDGMKRWHGGGKFLVVLMFISLITNGALTIYSFGISIQTLGRPLARFPRYIYVIFGSILWYVLTAIGQSGWAEVVGSFLPMIGYWSMIYFAIVAIESLWFRRHAENDYDWAQYLNPDHFKVMYAAIVAFGFGVAGVVIGMDQAYYVGRLASAIGKGCELGTLLAFGFSAVAYIPLRYLEIRWRKESPITP